MATTTATYPATFTIGGDLTVNRLGYGAMRITGEGIWGPPADRAESIRVLRRAVELGVDFIDTADSYGPNVSEELIAEALHPYAKGLVIGTKGGLLRTGPNQWPIDANPKHLEEVLHGSLKRLKLDQIDLYQLHRVDPNVSFEDTLKFLQRPSRMATSSTLAYRKSMQTRLKRPRNSWKSCRCRTCTVLTTASGSRCSTTPVSTT